MYLAPNVLASYDADDLMVEAFGQGSDCLHLS